MVDDTRWSLHEDVSQFERAAPQPARRTREEAVMRISVDPDLCEANGVCVGLAPGVFSLDDDELLHIEQPDEATIDLQRVSRAVDLCPKQALRIDEE